MTTTDTREPSSDLDTPDEAASPGGIDRREFKVTYDEKPARVFDSETINGAYVPPQFLFPVTTSVGDPDRGLAEGTVKITETYTTSDRHHNAMEPHVTLASGGQAANSPSTRRPSSSTAARNWSP